MADPAEPDAAEVARQIYIVLDLNVPTPVENRLVLAHVMAYVVRQQRAKLLEMAEEMRRRGNAASRSYGLLEAADLLTREAAKLEGE